MVSVSWRAGGRQFLTAFLFAALLGFLRATTVSSQEAKGPRKDGLYLNVPTALKQDDVRRLEQRIQDALKKERRTIETVIFDFNPAGQPNSSNDFGACESLRKLIGKLRSGDFDRPMKTVAFVSNEVSRHSVLPVLACSELVMANDPDRSRVGKIGDVLKGSGDLDDVERTAYEQMAQKTGARALVFKMIHPNIEIHKVKLPDGSIRYRDKKEMEASKDGAEDLGVPEGLGLGQAAYDADRARKFGLCKAIYNEPAELVRAYRLPRSIFTEVWIGDRPPLAGLIEVHGTLDKGKLQALERRIDKARGRNVNFLILFLDCPGGDNTDEAFRLGQRLAELKNDSGDSPVRTVAYVPSGVSLGAGTYLALGCNEIVMGKDAVLGDFGYLKTENDDDHAGRREQLVKLAQQQGYPPALFEAMLDRRVGVVRVQSRADAQEYQIVRKKDFEADKNSGAPKWHEAGQIHAAGEFFKLTAAKDREQKLEIANPVEIKSIDLDGQLDELYRLYNLPPERVVQFRDDWLDVMAEFFRKPLVKLLLIMVGIIGMILELKMPGVTLPGIVAAVCFVLFFWAHSFIGEYTMLAVLLFVLGLILVGLEVFVFPGFGVPGIAGVLLVVGSLVLVTLEKMPSTTQDWVNLGFTLTTFGAGLGAAIFGAFMLAWYLPHIPYANRLVLAPPPQDSETDGAMNPLAGLLGAIGVAETSLRPAGKARFGEDFYDVIAEGDFVSPGGRVQVIEIEGQRIVVKEV